MIPSPRQQGEAAVRASRALRLAGTERKNVVLERVAATLDGQQEAILAANEMDLDNASNANRPAAFLDRLRLNSERLRSLAVGIRNVASLPDPVGAVLSRLDRPDGLAVERVRVPIGVIAMIYESRPGVTVESAALCLKSGNACILRSGSDAAATSLALATVFQDAVAAEGIARDAVQMLADRRHEAVSELTRLDGLVDLVIARGGENLIRSVVATATVPVLKHYKGVCHAYVHCAADFEKAVAIIVNGKCQRPGVCNALETVLVDRAAAADFLPRLGDELTSRGVELRADTAARSFLPQAVAATEEDWGAEYLDLVLAIRVVEGIDAAIDHIARYGSKHSDAIISEDRSAQKRFTDEVDSAAVFVNASTRLCDGGELGLGTEIGISTDKLHARGPMGLDELTTYQWRVRGDGHIRG